MLDLAIKLARARPLIIPRGSSSISRFAAVLETKDKIYVGWNSYKSHPLMLQFSKDPNKVSLHAEISCLHKAILEFTSRQRRHRKDLHGFDLSGSSLSIARVLADGSPANARPCSICQNAIQRFKVTEVLWTT